MCFSANRPGKSSNHFTKVNLISLALKHRLTDKSVVNKQQVWPALVNTALQKLAQINSFYSNITIYNEWEDLSEQSGPVLWKLLTDKNAQEPNNIDG